MIYYTPNGQPWHIRKFQMHRSRDFPYRFKTSPCIKNDHAEYKIGCPEEAALTKDFLSLEQFEKLLQHMPNYEYRDYLASLAFETRMLRELK